MRHTPSVIGNSIPKTAREVTEHRRSRHGALHDPSDLGDRRLCRRALRDERARVAVAAVGAVSTSRSELPAHPGEAGKGLRPGTNRLCRGAPSPPGPCGVISAALRVVAEPEAVDAARRERDHVLRRRAELHAGEIRIHVHPEDRRVDRVLELARRGLSSSLAITAALGSPCAISSAMFGPESTATGRSRTSVESRSPVAGSRPFVRQSTAPSPRAAPRRPRRRRGSGRRGRRGLRSSRAPRDRQRRDVRQVDVGQVARDCGRSRRSPRACSGSRQTSVTSCSRSASRRAKAVPHEPPPTTAAFTGPNATLEGGAPSRPSH